ncbi:MAG: cysteine desulfurase family protein [Dongiaceae bacterium]
MQSATYLDYNATSPLRPAVAAAISDAMSLVGNPSSVHRFGRAARARIEVARDQVAALVGAHPSQLVFTSGGTEANNLALAGCPPASQLVSAIEHDSVLRAAPRAVRVPVTPDGLVDLQALAELLRSAPGPALVSVMLANNETGVVQPVAEAAALAHRAGALVHCDAVQAAGKMIVDFAELGVDMMTLSAHKLGGPQGCGALIVADQVPLQVQQRGGGQERGRRAGTENVAAIVGFGVAAELAGRELSRMAEIARLRDRLERDAKRSVPAAVVFGAGSARLPNTSCLGLPGMPAETQVMALDLDGVAVSAGSACSSGKVRPSHVLAAMGVGAELAASAIRVSLGWRTTVADVEAFLSSWRKLAARRGLLSAEFEPAA